MSITQSDLTDYWNLDFELELSTCGIFLRWFFFSLGYKVRLIQELKVEVEQLGV